MFKIAEGSIGNRGPGSSGPRPADPHRMCTARLAGGGPEITSRLEEASSEMLRAFTRGLGDQSATVLHSIQTLAPNPNPNPNPNLTLTLTLTLTLYLVGPQGICSDNRTLVCRGEA
eukprot:1393751-Amorphochlora_amoeboformis.AAC.2